ncbi:MAG: hypothetical protein JWO83_2578 [Caulobacteraceae bacterium]|jgi:hypothetical protein|nr:hypothetical protein [Caulobacteraceae bacterium]
MTAFAPTAAALEGYRLIRREPRAVLAWTLLWLAVVVATALAVATGPPVVLAHGRAYSSPGDIVRKFGPAAPFLILLFLVVWATTTVAAYRVVLRPQERRFFFLRLGLDELRLAIMTVVSAILILVFGGAPAYLLLVLADPLMRALPALARDIARVGALLTVCVDVWLGVRLSLIAVETVAERRFHLSAYWPLTRGRFWYLLACYIVCFLMVFGLTTLLFLAGGVLVSLANLDLAAGNLLRRTSVLGIAALLAVVTSAFLMLSSTIFCACQAYAFRVIAAGGKAGVVIS